MKKYYGKRSSLVHNGENTIDGEDSKTVENIFRSLILKLLDLSNTYNKMDQKSHEKDEEGVEDYLNSLKFS